MLHPGPSPTPRRRASRRGATPRRARLVALLASATLVVVAVVASLLTAPAPTSAPDLTETQPAATAVGETADWFPAIGTFQLWCTMGNPGCSGYHGYPAMDIGMPVGTRLYAAGPGTVTIAAGGCSEGDSSCNGAAGNYVAIKHPDGRTSRYLHLSSIGVTVGQKLARGQYLGLSGFTGRTTAPHLHYDETDANGTYVDPGPMWVRKNGATVKYPDDLGYTSWWSVPAFSTYLQNDGYVRSASFGDFDGNGNADRTTYEPSTGTWRTAGVADVALGGPGQIPVPGEYNGDGRTEAATYEPATGTWRVQGASDLTLGGPGQAPVAGDWTGGGQWEPAVYNPANGVWTIAGGSPITLGGPGQQPVPADYDASGKIEAATYEATTGTWRFADGTTAVWGGPGQLPVPGDYTGDGKAELATYAPATGTWRIKGLVDLTLGGPGQVPVPADYGSQGKVVPATYAPATGTWKVLGQTDVVAGGPGRIPVASQWPALVWRLASGAAIDTDLTGDLRGETPLWRPSTGAWLGSGGASFNWGLAGDVPLVGDLNGDARAEAIVYRPSTGIWYANIAGMWPFQLTAPQAGDVPLLADLDGGGWSRPAIYRPATGQWFFVGGSSITLGGQPGDVPVAADTNGDGKAEPAVFRQGQWRFADGSVVNWGLPGDVPLAADLDGDGRDDLVVYRPSESAFYVRLAGWSAITVGQAGDVPLATDVDGDARADLAVLRPSTGQVIVRGGATTTIGQAGDLPAPLGTHVGVRPPGAPSGVAAAAGTSAALVSWSAPADNGGQSVIGYQVTASPGGATVTVDGPSTAAVVPGLTLGTPYTFTVAARTVAGLGASSVPSAAVTPALPPATGFHALAPSRVLDTRSGSNVALAGPFTAGQTRSLDVTGAGGVPATGASAVVLNVTVTGGTAPSFITAWPGGQARPLASNLNFGAGQTVANLVVTTVGPDGTVNLYNNSGTVNVVADVVGWFDTNGNGDRYSALTPSRILDTRDGTGGTGPAGTAVPLAGGESRNLTVIGRGGVPTSATAVVLNVTATGGTAASYLTAYPAGQTAPLASNLNFLAGQTVPNLVVVPVGANGQISIFNNAGTTNVIADVVGFFAPAPPSASNGGFVGMVPSRILDTRDGTGAPRAKLGPGQSLSFKVTGVGGLDGVPSTGVSAVVLNITVTGPTAPAFLTVWPTGVPMPTASNLNFVAGQTVPNLVMARVGSDGTVSVFNNAGSVDVIADVVGWYS